MDIGDGFSFKSLLSHNKILTCVRLCSAPLAHRIHNMPQLARLCVCSDSDRASFAW